MNILYLLFSFTTGGTERLVTDICNEMVLRGHQVHLYVVNDLYDQSMLEALNPQVRVQLQKRPAGSGGKLQTLFRIANYIRNNRVQVVHCNSLDAPELLLLTPLLASNVKVLYTVHGMHQLQGKSSWKIQFRNRLCHRIIAISDCVKADIIAAGIQESKVVTIHNAIDLSRFPEPSQKHLDPAAPVIGNVARIHPQIKGQDILIRAIAQLKKQLPNIQCYLAGSPAKNQPEALTGLVELVQQLELTDNITFLGNVQDVPSFLSKIDIFVLPSRSEGFGISLVEAMAMGIPCVASDLEGPAEVLAQGKYGLLFRATDPNDLADKLETLLLNYPSYRSTAIQQANQIRTQYDIVRMCDQLEALMDK